MGPVVTLLQHSDTIPGGEDPMEVVSATEKEKNELTALGLDIPTSKCQGPKGG